MAGSPRERRLRARPVVGRERIAVARVRVELRERFRRQAALQDQVAVVRLAGRDLVVHRASHHGEHFVVCGDRGCWQIPEEIETLIPLRKSSQGELTDHDRA